MERPATTSPSTARRPVGRFTLSNFRAAWWAFRAVRRTRRALREQGLDAAHPASPPPPLPAEAERGVRAVLRRTGDACLVRSIVLQAWLGAHGEPPDLIIGVKIPDEEFAAHAWLDGEAPHAEGPFHELLRRPA